MKPFLFIDENFDIHFTDQSIIDRNVHMNFAMDLLLTKIFIDNKNYKIH